MYVVTNKRYYKGKCYTSCLLRESYREDGKVKNRTIANLSHLPADIIEMISERLRTGKPIVNQGFEIIRSLPHGHVAAILQIIKRLELDKIISSVKCLHRDVVLALIVLRLIYPASKLATHKMIIGESASSTLGMELRLQSITRHHLYEALDWLIERKERIEKKLANRHLKEGTLVFFDLTSTYYTGKESELVQYGYNRDKKKGFPQIVFGILCNEEGIPVAVEVFSGNRSDATVLAKEVEKVHKKFGVKRLVWVGDRGLVSSKAIDKSIRLMEGVDWITALGSKQIKKLLQQEDVQTSLFDERGLAEIISEDYPGERLIVCKNPLLEEERRQEREELLEATCKELDKVVKATQRKRNPLCGKSNIGVSVGRVINKYKMQKHIRLYIKENSFRYEVDQQSVLAEAALDGLYVIRTSLLDSVPSEKVVRWYKNLSHVERAFRSIKTTRLLVRPIFLRNNERIKAHIFLCMLAYYVEWHAQQLLSPMLYAEDMKEEAEVKRKTPVSPAQKSDSALRKAATHRASNGFMVHSMDTLWTSLGTICNNEIQYNNNKKTFWKKTEPNKEQKEILKLLKVSL